MTEFNLRDLNKQVKASDIDFRVQSINKGGYATVLAYKDARYDMRVLDEVVGPANWSKDYKLIDGNLYCGISINVGSATAPNWVTKWDVGVESNTEAQKGQASDAQKRAGFAWGIGRELYDFPMISIKLNKDEFEVDGANRVRATFKLNMRQWNWEVIHTEDGSINVRASDADGVVRFDSSPAAQKAPVRMPVRTQAAAITEAVAPAIPEPTVMGIQADNTFQQAIDYMKLKGDQVAYDSVVAKYGSKFSDAQKKALSKFIKK